MKHSYSFFKSIKKLLVVLSVFMTSITYSQDVLVIFGSTSNPDLTRATDISTRLQNLNVFNSVTGVHLNSANQLSLSDLNQYDAIMIATNAGYSASWGFDAVLRDYVDAGGGVAVMMFANASIPLGSNWPYNALLPASQSSGTTSIGDVQLPEHPALNFPYTINTDTWTIGSTYSSTATDLATGAYSIFEYADGRPGLQALENVGTSGLGRVIDLAIWPSYNSQHYTNGDQLIANVLTWLMGAIQVTQTGNCINANQSDFTFIDNNDSNPVVSYVWDFGDSTTSTLVNPTKVYTTSGIFPVTVTVTRQNSQEQTYGTSVTIFDLPSTADAGSDVTLTGGTTSTSLTPTTPAIGAGTWSFVSGPNTPTLTQSNTVANLSGLIDGNYEFSWTVANGTCTVSTDNITVNVGDNLSTGATVGLPELKLYPNPASDYLMIGKPGSIGIDKVTVFDLTGRRLEAYNYTNTVNQTEVKVDLSSLPIASYILHIQATSGLTVYKMITKK